MFLLVAAVRVHRMLLVLGTVGLAISGSRVADQPANFTWICVLLAFGSILWLSDLCREIDDRALQLSRDTKVKYSKAASDYLSGADLVKIVVALVGIAVLVVLAVYGTFW
ncbi:hypothetical protein BAUR920_03537 [Brevibacterium aurantiacum]|uniref:Uncharacterized protein n=1 Tax=Brevibacterium aurantiacum TaxID=273384 RepID=A0A2H1KS33_BREAU|nr:hypothetical protein BAUR920_03537 [Brevibacterium aurantiacum]